jgi:hypothetical protein
MPTHESEIELLARAMVERHGVGAAKAAVGRLNQMIDRGDWAGRDRWACVVRAIHESLSVGPAYTPRDRGMPSAPAVTHAA